MAFSLRAPAQTVNRKGSRFVMLTLAMMTFVRGTRSGALRFAFMVACGQKNVLAIQALAARFRVYAAETSLEIFRRKFEATADELERLAGVPLTAHINVRKFPGTGNARGYGH